MSTCTISNLLLLLERQTCSQKISHYMQKLIRRYQSSLVSILSLKPDSTIKIWTVMLHGSTNRCMTSVSSVDPTAYGELTWENTGVWLVCLLSTLQEASIGDKFSDTLMPQPAQQVLPKLRQSLTQESQFLQHGDSENNERIDFWFKSKLIA